MSQLLYYYSMLHYYYSMLAHLLPADIPALKHFCRRHAWQLLRRNLSMVQLFVAGHM